MRKLFLAMMLFTASLSFGQRPHFRPLPDLSKCYEVEIDIRRLADKLQLDDIQSEYVMTINDNLLEEVSNASTLDVFRRTVEVRKAVHKNLTQLKYILNDEQFKEYTALFFTTVRNNLRNTVQIRP